MKLNFVTFLFVFMFASQVFALEVIVSNPCTEKPHIRADVDVINSISVGALTVKILEEHQLAFEGSETGIISIENSPKSLEALEILSETSMRSHGWCYLLDGKLSSLLADEQMIDHSQQKLYWYYGYFSFENGVWGGRCEHIQKSFQGTFCDDEK